MPPPPTVQADSNPVVQKKVANNILLCNALDCCTHTYTLPYILCVCINHHIMYTVMVPKNSVSVHLCMYACVMCTCVSLCMCLCMMCVRPYIRKDVRTYTHTSPLHAKLAHCQVMPRCGSCGSIQCAFGAYVRTYLFLNCCSHLALLEQWALRIFSRLQETLDDVPYGIRWLCKAIRVLVKVRRAFCSVGEWGVLLCGEWGVLLCGSGVCWLCGGVGCAVV